MDYKPLRFINEPVEVEFDQPPLFEKVPGPPTRFRWRGEWYPVLELIQEWHDYSRRGRMASNMRPSHSETAARRGSWGVGQFYFRVRSRDDRVFDIYFDRAPKDVDNRKGAWIIDREMAADIPA